MYKLISVDDHLVESPSLWTDRLPQRYREVGPRWVPYQDGECWVAEGRPTVMLNNEIVVGRPYSEWGAVHRPIRMSDMLLPYYDSKARAELLRIEGMIGAVCFPTYPRFSGTRFLEFEDKQLADLCVQAFNDWVIDEWCAAAPGFYIPMTITQVWDPELGAQEVRRCAARGARAISMPENPVPLGLPSYHTGHWDPVWRAVAETGVAVCMHIGTSGSLPVLSDDAPFGTTIVLAQINAQMALVNLLFSRVVREFPTINFVLSEGGIGWLPAVLERSDRMWEVHRQYADDLGDLKPSETFARSFYGCFIGDRTGIELRHKIGVEHIMWEGDYPHAESPWPDTQKSVHEQLHDVPADEAELMTHGNAERVFNWSPSR
jgi:predicted TIM-barrel fold metal-dependent hydrolase